MRKQCLLGLDIICSFQKITLIVLLHFPRKLCACLSAEIEVEVTLRLTVSQSVCLGVGHPLGAHDQILLFRLSCRKIDLLFVLGRPFWRQEASVICSVIVSGQSRGGLITIHYCWGRGYSTTDGQSECLGIEHPDGTCDQILLPVGMLLSEIFGLLYVGLLLWREDGSAIYSVITQWSESRRTRTHTLLSHMRLPQPEGPGSRICIPQEQGGVLNNVNHLRELRNSTYHFSKP
jgi:hypothetical protein